MLWSHRSFSLVPPTEVEPISIGCTYNDDCPDHAACRNSACINPCAAENPCAPSAICTVVKHEALCSCPDGYIGTPEIDCRLRKYLDSKGVNNEYNDERAVG